MSEERMAAGEFKAQCLKLMSDIQKTKMPLVITKRGKPVVRVMPYVDEVPDTFFGCVEGSASLNEQDVVLSESAPSHIAPEEYTLDDFTDDNFGHQDDQLQGFYFEPDESDVASDAVPEDQANSGNETKKPLPIHRQPPSNRGLPLKHEARQAVDVPLTEQENEDIFIPSADEAENAASTPEQFIAPESPSEPEPPTSAMLKQQYRSAWNRPATDEGEGS